MARHTEDDDGEEFSGSSDNDDDDNFFDEDMEALRRACMLTGTDPKDLNPSSSTAIAITATAAADSDGGDSCEFDDLELVRSIQQRYSISDDFDKPLSLKPLSFVPPTVSDDEVDDFETLRAIQRRFEAYDSDALKKSPKHSLQKPEQVRASIASEKEPSIDLLVNRTNACEGFPDPEGVCKTIQNLDLPSDDNVPGIQPSGFIECHQSNAHKLSALPLKCSSFPKSAQVFIDAIKKNRSWQRFLRNKLIQIEARIEENKKLKDRVKILKDFQISCRKRTGRALCQKKDPRVQLISAPKLGASKDSKVNDKKASAMYYGPAENSHVPNYRMALTKYPLSLHRQKWSNAEIKDLSNGIRQEFQKALLEKSVDLFSGSDGSYGDSNDIDNIIASIKDLEITPENIRLYIPKIDWKKFASIYIKGRSGAECEARWLNFEDPLINHNPWTTVEDKNLLLIVQQRGINNWIDIAVSLGSNRTPFQCLARYQRSLNASVMKSGWTDDEDNQLRSAVETFGEGNWQLIASTLEGRTGTQCSNRWRKTLHPARQRVGRWTLEEDKRLKVAVMLFGPKTWKKIAQFVPGRTQVQCRERWVNSLDPSLNWDEWTEEEDSRLRAAIVEHGYCWYKVAACVPPRTDSQCRRRWKVLLPHEVPQLQAARKIQKAALISNFVDRESERPALGPNDFVPLPVINSVPELENINPSRKRKTKPRERPESQREKDAAFCNVRKKVRSKRPRKNTQISSVEIPGMNNSDEFETVGMHGAILKKGLMEPSSKKKKCTYRAQEDSSPHMDLSLLMIDNSQGVAVFGGDDITKNKMSSKQHSKGKCTEPAERPSLPVSLPQSLELRTTNGAGIETLGGTDTASTSKKRAPKQHDTTKKKKAPKPHSKRNECTEPDESQSLLLLPPHSLESGMVDGEGVETLGGNKTTSTKKRRAPERQPKKKICIEESGKHQNSALSSRNSMLIQTTDGAEFRPDHSSSCRDSTFLMRTNGEEICTFGVNDTFIKRRAPKSHLKGKKSTEPTKDSNSLSSGSEILKPRIIDGNGTPNFSVVDNTTFNKNRRAPKQSHRQKKCTEESEESQDTFSVTFSVACQEDGTKMSTTRCKSSSTPISRTTNEDSVALASIPHGTEESEESQDTFSVACQEDGPKMSTTGCKSSSTPISGTTNEDSVAHASILHSKLEKRLKPAEGGSNHACSPSNECQDFASVCQDGPKDSTTDKSFSAQISGPTDENDSTLASFLCDELKKRRPELVKSGSQVPSPSSKEKGSELLSNGVDQLNDRNQMHSPM